MNRITKPISKNADVYCDYVIGNYIGIYKDCELGRVVSMLGEYENTGLTPKEIEQLKGECVGWKSSAKEYEEAEKRGLLIRLPCKVGDTVWIAVTTVRVKEVAECVVDEISIDDHAPIVVLRRKGEPRWRRMAYYIECFGATVFLTREEAEVALQRIANHGT